MKRIKFKKPTLAKEQQDIFNDLVGNPGDRDRSPRNYEIRWGRIAFTLLGLFLVFVGCVKIAKKVHPEPVVLENGVYPYDKYHSKAMGYWLKALEAGKASGEEALKRPTLKVFVEEDIYVVPQKMANKVKYKNFLISTDAKTARKYLDIVQEFHKPLTQYEKYQILSDPYLFTHCAYRLRDTYGVGFDKYKYNQGFPGLSIFYEFGDIWDSVESRLGRKDLNVMQLNAGSGQVLKEIKEEYPDSKIWLHNTYEEITHYPVADYYVNSAIGDLPKGLEGKLDIIFLDMEACDVVYPS